ncbi:MAG: WecB/TagA/CpsF family glycosyltransferase [Pseudomonadota bacterium]|nr:WecB/TagA/CpsF family glycosyltransferase [Pseudomonadota bacterium]
MPKFNAQHLLQQIHVCDDSEVLIEQVITQSQSKQGFTTLGFMNQHGVNLIAKDNALLKPFTDLDYILRDGIGMKLAFKFFKMPAGANLNGTDFIPQLVNTVSENNTDFFVFGTQGPWLEKGSQKLLAGREFHTLDGFQALSVYIDYLNEHIKTDRFNVIILAMGMPKQEQLAALIKQKVKQPGLVICGGAIIDFQAERFPRAPKIFRTLSIEWLYRLLKEPRRLFKRYVIGIPVFFINLNKYR